MKLTEEQKNIIRPMHQKKQSYLACANKLFGEKHTQEQYNAVAIYLRDRNVGLSVEEYREVKNIEI